MKCLSTFSKLFKTTFKILIYSALAVVKLKIILLIILIKLKIIFCCHRVKSIVLGSKSFFFETNFVFAVIKISPGGARGSILTSHVMSY